MRSLSPTVPERVAHQPRRAVVMGGHAQRGGQWERELVNNYRDLSRQLRWPRTAAICARLVDGYKHMAARAYRRAEAHQRTASLRSDTP